MIHEITDETFEAEVANSDVPCVIEFTAGFCTLCDEMVPTLEELADHYGDAVKFCIVNTDTSKKLRIKFVVGVYPYIVMVHGGKRTPLFDEKVTTERLRERIDFMLENGEAPTTRPL